MAKSAAKKHAFPKLVMGHIEVVGADGEDGIPYDEAVIHLEGDEDSEIEIHCPGALRLAPQIVTAVNSHADLVKALERAERLCNEALPKFNWAKSALDANAIALLNEVPGEISRALKAAKAGV